MNEQIKQLAEIAGIHQPDRFDAIDGSNQLERFAELVAEACAAMLEHGSFLSPESTVALAANGAAKAIRSGEWKKHMKKGV